MVCAPLLADAPGDEGSWIGLHFCPLVRKATSRTRQGFLLLLQLGLGPNARCLGLSGLQILISSPF